MGLDHLFALRPGQTPRPTSPQLRPPEAPPASPYSPTPQNRDPAPPVLRRHSSSDISKQKFGTMPLVPIRGDESNSSMLSANQTLVRERSHAPSSLRVHGKEMLKSTTDT